MIGTLASTNDIPVDVVTGDRDLFQLVDDSRDVRVIYTGRGMSNLEVLTDAALVAKTGVRPDQYADYAAMRGDASDGLPGVAGIGEKGAATLLATYGDLNGIIAAAADEASDLAKGPRAKILAAAEYLEVAPAVVNVVRDLKLPAFDARIRAFTAGTRGRHPEPVREVGPQQLDGTRGGRAAALASEHRQALVLVNRLGLDVQFVVLKSNPFDEGPDRHVTEEQEHHHEHRRRDRLPRPPTPST